jgi:outer membrane receptor protein involved in Fe transport
VAYTDGPVQYDYDVAYRSLSPYVQAEWSPTSRLRFDLGARYDLTGFVYSTNLAPVDTGAHRIAPNMTVNYGHLSPKLGVTFDVTPSLNLYASYRNGFRAPSQSQLFQMNSASNAFDLEPVTVNSLEAGIRGGIGSRVVYELDGYDMRINNDILTYITPINTREASNAGATRHRGIETSVGVQLLPSFRADVAYSVSSQRYVQWSPSSTVSYAGRLIEQAPKYLGNLLLSYAPKALNGGRAAVEIVSVGGYYMDPENTHTYGGYTEANLLFDWPVTPAAGLFVRVTNLTDRNYAEIATYDVFQKGQYTPAEPRTVRAGARFKWSR